MKRQGICQKCGKNTIVQDHHINGYLGKNKDKVVPYCQSCDLKAHAKAKREGKCNLNPLELQRLTNSSSKRRSIKTLTLSCNTIESNILLFEQIYLNVTGEIYFSSFFGGNHGIKLKQIEE